MGLFDAKRRDSSATITVSIDETIERLKMELDRSTYDPRTGNFGATSYFDNIKAQLASKAVQYIWEQHKEEIVAQIDWKTLTPTLIRLSNEKLAQRAINPNGY